MKNKFSRRVFSMLLATVMLLLLLPLGAAATEPETGTETETVYRRFSKTAMAYWPGERNELISASYTDSEGIEHIYVMGKEYNKTLYGFSAVPAERLTGGSAEEGNLYDYLRVPADKTATVVRSQTYSTYDVKLKLPGIDNSGKDAYIGESVVYNEEKKRGESLGLTVTDESGAKEWDFYTDESGNPYISGYYADIALCIPKNGGDPYFTTFPIYEDFTTTDTFVTAYRIYTYECCDHANMEYHAEVSPSCNKTGTNAYYFCPDCNTYYGDKLGLTYSGAETLAKLGCDDADGDKKCDSCGRNISVYSLVTSEDEIVAGGEYILVSGNYAMAAGKDQYGCDLPAVPVTVTDGKIEFQSAKKCASFELRFAAGCTEWGNGIRYGIISSFNKRQAELAPDGKGSFYWNTYSSGSAKYGYYIGLNEDGSVKINSAYDPDYYFRTYSYTDEKLGTTRIFTMCDYSSNESYSFVGKVYLYRLVDVGTVNDVSYQLVNGKSTTDYKEYDENGAEAEAGTTVTGVTSAMKQSSIDSYVSRITGLTDVKLNVNVAVTVKGYSPDESKNEGGNMRISLSPTMNVVGTDTSFPLSDKDLDGSPMTVTLFVGNLNPERIIHEKQDGTLEIFYAEYSEEAQKGEKTFSMIYDGSGNAYVVFEITEFSDIVILERVSGAFSDVSVSLGTDITVNYFATLPEGYTDAEMRFTMNGVSKTVSGTKVEGSTYKFVYTGVAPQCIGDTITAEIIKNGTVLKTKAYTVKTYLETLKGMTAEDLGYSEEKYTAMVKLIKDLLVYGGAAQTYIGHNTGDLVSDGITGSDFTDLISTARTAVNNDGAVKFTGMSLWFDNVNKLIFRFTASDTTNIKIGIKAGDGAEVYYTSFTPAGGSQYTVMTDGIYATGFDTVYTATIYTDDVAGAIVTYSVNSYVYAMQNSEKATMQALAKATYNYGVSAVKFKNK